MPSLACSAALLFMLAQSATPAPSATPNPGREFFVSWGYNGDGFAKSDMHFKQPSLKNDFTLFGVQADDSKAWDIYNHAPTVPQYNIRFGMFFNEKWGLELALDHIKWIVRQGQAVHVTGTLGGAAVDTTITLTEDVLKYKLNNGANPVFVNAVRRWRLAGQPKRTGYLTFLAKAGGGMAMPHTENTLFGVNNEKGFQFFHGWDVDAGVAARLHLYKRLYFEFEEKVVYAKYFGVKVDQGEASHSLKANEFTWNFGVSFK
jgi:hypothetical protein